jgi:D-glycero-D-manno-heptose 1,7-bisphosphate phosphatase
MNPLKTVLMAGGKGTRIASVAPDVPKPMIRLCSKPILEHQLDCLKRNGLTDIIIVTGHLGQTIQDYFGDGSGFGCSISYYAETEPLGTAGALYWIRDALTDDFLLIHGDIIFDLDFSRFAAFHRARGAQATLAAHPNSHPYDSALLITDAECRVTGWLSKEEPRKWYKNQVNAGLHILSKRLLALPDSGGRLDLDRDVLKPNIARGGIYAYNTPEYIKDMGTPERYAEVAADIASGAVAARNLSHKQKAVFLDRDGTINKPNGFIRMPDEFELLDGAADALRVINQAGYLVIVATNQPVIARGAASLEDLAAVHRKMEAELGRAGAYLDDIFFCPHHPDKGFAGERPEYKVACECRKPKPGLLLQAAEKYNIDLSQSYMVGDEPTDAQAGIAAGCKTAFGSLAEFVEYGRQHLFCGSAANYV